MIDQADTLRRLMQLRKAASSGASAGAGTRIVTFSSGGLGDGKSSVVSHLAVMLARAGRRVLVANSEWLRPAYALDAFSPETGQDLGSYLATPESGLHFGHFSDSFYSACNSAGLLEHGLAHVMEQLGIRADFVLVEAGLRLCSGELGHVQRPEFMNVIVVTPDYRALGRTQTLLANLRREMGLGRFGVIVNKVGSVPEGHKVFKGLADFAKRFVDVRLEYLGCVPREENIARGLVDRKFLVDLSRGDSSVACLRLVTKRLETWGSNGELSEISQVNSKTRSVYGRTGV